MLLVTVTINHLTLLVVVIINHLMFLVAAFFNHLMLLFAAMINHLMLLIAVIINNLLPLVIKTNRNCSWYYPWITLLYDLSILNHPAMMIGDTTLSWACHSWNDRVPIHALWSIKHILTNRSSWPGHFPTMCDHPLAGGATDTCNHRPMCHFPPNVKVWSLQPQSVFGLLLTAMVLLAWRSNFSSGLWVSAEYKWLLVIFCYMLTAGPSSSN